MTNADLERLPIEMPPFNRRRFFKYVAEYFPDPPSAAVPSRGGTAAAAVAGTSMAGRRLELGVTPPSARLEPAWSEPRAERPAQNVAAEQAAAAQRMARAAA
eukprot:SAG11_NODE_10625_length_816_cov_1.039052_1_plen_101_part_10